MDRISPICLTCVHFGKPNGSGCRAFPEGIPYGYPPNNKHDKIIKGQTGKYTYVFIAKKEKAVL